MKSLMNAPYFSPLMIYDFAGLPSDGGDEVLISSIDLISALTSERYHHSNAKEVFIDGKKWVYAERIILIGYVIVQKKLRVVCGLFS